MKAGKAWHPFLLPVFPVLAFYGTNVYEVPWTDLVLPIVLVLAASSFFLFLSSALHKNKEKSSCLVSMFWIFFFSFGHVQLLVRQWRIGGLEIGRDRYVFLALVILFLIASFILYRNDRRTAMVSRLLQRFSFILFTVSLGFCFVSAYVHAGTDSLPSSVLSKISRLKPVVYSPDIYHIVLDGYGRSDVLKELYGYDNSRFLDHLKQKGFYIASQSRSNYVHTYLSMSSALNFEYLQPLSPSHSTPFSNFQRKSTAYGGLKSNLVFHILRKLNYKIISFYSEYGITTVPRSDIYIGSSNKIRDFHYALLNTTPARIFSYKNRNSIRLSQYRYDRHRQTILSTLNYLPKLAKETRDHPVYAYVHIISPHPPFVFTQDGEPLDVSHPFSFWDDLGLQYLEGGLRSEYIQGYKWQVIFISNKIAETVSKILEASPRPPIIIIQGDHGPSAFVNWHHPEPIGLKERFSILNAYYFPGGGDRLLYDSISPVNTYRVLFNYYFGANFPLLADINYFTLLDGELVPMNE